MVNCDNKECNNKGMVHVGIKGKVRLICVECFKNFKDSNYKLREYNPQSNF